MKHYKQLSNLVKCASLSVFCVLFLPAFGRAETLIWSNEFDSGTAPDPNVWSYDVGGGGWGNSELQTYTTNSANVSVQGGYLHITGQEQSSNRGKHNSTSFTSARINTENKLTVLYGDVEVGIEIPDLANGLWPAFWTLGNDYPVVGWPNCGEIDMMEMGSAAAISSNVVNSEVDSTAHWYYNGNASYGVSYVSPTNLETTFHVYRMNWTTNMITTYLDGNFIWAIDISNPEKWGGECFHLPHFLILQLAVGGNFTGITSSSGVTAPFPADMKIDYIRIYDNGNTVLGGSSLGNPTASWMFDSSLSTGISGHGRSQNGTATIGVVNGNGFPVTNATVMATFTGSYNETVSATTGSNGLATLTTAGTAGGTVSFTVCVDSITASSMTYVPKLNVVNCNSYP